MKKLVPAVFLIALFSCGEKVTSEKSKTDNILENLPLGGFFKDGKLWSYVNVEDELGFAVFTFDF